jgi:hypothetical protein
MSFPESIPHLRKKAELGLKPIRVPSDGFWGIVIGNFSKYSYHSYDNSGNRAFSNKTISNFGLFHFRLRLISILFAISTTKNI